MSLKALLGAYADERRKEIFHAHEDGGYSIETRQDCSHIVQAARVLADEPPGKDFRHVGFIPDAVMNAAFREGWIHDKAKWKQWFNDPENRAFRTWQGRL